jgi:hypothetical protein
MRRIRHGGPWPPATARPLDVSSRGYYAWLAREPCARTLADTKMLAGIRTVHLGWKTLSVGRPAQEEWRTQVCDDDPIGEESRFPLRRDRTASEV